MVEIAEEKWSVFSFCFPCLCHFIIQVTAKINKQVFEEMTNRKRVSKNVAQSESKVLPVERILSPFSLLSLTNLLCHIVPMVSSSCPWKLTCSLRLLHLLDAPGPCSAVELHHAACEITGLFVKLLDTCEGCWLFPLQPLFCVVLKTAVPSVFPDLL